MNYAINYFGNGKVVITKKGTIRVGEITMQRKGGDKVELLQECAI